MSKRHPAEGPGPAYQIPSPFYRTANVLTTHLEPGFVITELRPGGDVTDAAGRLLPGVAVAVADTALGAAIYSVLPPTRACQTVELRLDYLPGTAARSDRVVARGLAVHVGATTALARGEILDSTGRLRALATCRSVVREVAEDEHVTLRPASGAEARFLAAPSAELRSEREVTSPADLDGFLRLELARRLGITIESTGARTVVTRVPTSQALTNTFGIVHGAAVSLACDVAIAVALHALLPAGSGFAALDLAVNFLRPVSAAQRVTVEAELAHAGRRFSVVRAGLRNADGEIAALATSTAFLARR